MKILICILVLGLTSQIALASSFVGNGGNVGDMELQMTLGKLQKNFESIEGDKDAEKNVCTCSPDFQGRPVCDVLSKLNSDQVKFCAKYVLEKSGELAKILRQKDQISFSWTHEQIEVRDGGHLRSADAVTDAKSMKMTLNQKRFLEMNEQERVFLVGHELFHLTSYQGTTLTDEGEIGPFKGADGGRLFINAMAAALVIETSEYGIFSSYAAAERLSKSYKKTYLSLGYAALSTPNDNTTSFDINRTAGGQFGVRYQLTPSFGVVGQLSVLNGEKTIMETIKATEHKNILSGGVSYRWFPFSNPLTVMGQSHFVFSGMLDFLSGNYKYDEQGIGGSAETTSTGFTLACNYFIPFDGGFWGYASAGYSNMQYSYNLDNQLDLKYKDNGTTFALGVAYGF